MEENPTLVIREYLVDVLANKPRLNLGGGFLVNLYRLLLRDA